MNADLRWCRAYLPRVSRTFAINIRLLGSRMRDPVGIAYLLCRSADTLEDAWPGEGLSDRFMAFGRALDGDPAAASALSLQAFRAQARPSAELRLLIELPRLLRAYRGLPGPMHAVIAECVRTLSSGMCRYAERGARRGPGVAYLDDENELDDYCWVVAGCVGVMLTRLYTLTHDPGDEAAQARRLELAPGVGQALQLTNILLDWPNDVRSGRCYLPGTWLAEAGVRPSDLVERERPEVAALARRLEAKALGAIAVVPDYLDLVPHRHLRYRLFCLWPALWAVGSLRQARRDPEFPWGPRRPKLTRLELWRSSLASLLVADHGAALRRECAAVAR